MLWIIVFFTCLEISKVASADARIKTSSSLADSNSSPKKIDEEYLNNELDQPRSVEMIRGVAGRNVSLPCDILQQPRDANDAVAMLLWFKENSGQPLYSYDARKGRVRRGNSPHYWGAGAASKSGPPPKLLIQDLRESDEGVYRCRVDFRNSPTRNFMVNLSVIIPPSTPKIYDTKRRDMSNVPIAYADEGANLTLVCEVHGGRPKPRVAWFLGAQLINSSHEVKEIQGANGEINFVTVNRVTLEGLTRNRHNASLTCKASNTNLTRSASATVFVELNMRPLTVQILSKRRQVSSGKKYEVTCRSTGSTPPAVFTWWRGSKQLKTGITSTENNMSHLEWVPNPEDDGKYLTCRVENPRLPEAAIEDRWNLTVRYSPIVTLRMGLSLNPNEIKERDDVYFECNVRANPPAAKLTWYHEGAKLRHNVTGGVVLSDHSLVLQSITRKAAGKYSCLAENTEGRSSSNPVHLEVMFAPICKRIMNTGGSWRSQNATPPPLNVPEELHDAVKQHETISLTCEVEASPKTVTFRWSFNSSGELSDITSVHYTSEETVSRLNYTPPSTGADYGTIGCWANNRVGETEQPCLYQIVAAGRPYPLQNCTAYNNSSAWIRISCVEGFDGGSPQKFVAVMNEQRWESSSPYWELEVRNPTSVALYAVNVKGSSVPVTIDGRAFKGVAKFTGESAPVSSVDMSPILIGLGGTATGLGLIVTGVLMALWRRHATATPSKPKQPQQPTIATFTTKCDEEDGNPDLIPTTDLTNHAMDKKLSVYGTLPRRPCHLEGREMPHEVLENPDYPRASPNNFYSLQRPNRYSETIVRTSAIQESCI